MQKKRRGLGIIEAALGVVIAIGVTIGGVVLFQQTTENSRINDAIRSIVSIQSGIRSLYVNDSTFGESSDLVEATISAGIVPGKLINEDGTIVNEWGGLIEISGRPNAFVVDYQDVPLNACVRLAPHTALGTGAAGTGIAGVAINGNIVDTNVDGVVSPEEAAAACNEGARNVGGATISAMRWAFLPNASMSMEPIEVEDVLDVEPIEVGRTTETDSQACGAGFLGNQSRTRDIVRLSNGNTTTLEWSEWDRSQCEEIVEASRRTESETQACPTGLEGQQVRTRTVIVMTDGSERAEEWSSWDASDCHAVEVSRRTETENQACPTGMLGQEVRTREVLEMSDGTEQSQPWSAWDASACHVGVVNTREETDASACPTGFLGEQTRTRTVEIMSDGSEQALAWSSWNTSACYVGVVDTREETDASACPTGLLGEQTRTRTIEIMSDGSEQALAWSSWNTSACHVGVVSTREETGTAACPAGFLGEQSRTRTVEIMSDGTEQALAWSAWNTSACFVGVVSTRTETGSAACPAGYLGNQTRQRTINIMSNGTEEPQAWGAWDTSACYIGVVNTREETGKAACPTGYLGEQTRKRTINIMSDGSEQPQAWGAWNTSACYIGVVSTRTETGTAACPSGYLGNQTRQRTINIMSNGSEQPQAWSAWNTSACYIGVVNTRTEKQTQACPTGYTGNQTRQRTINIMSNGTEQPQAWSGWNTSACVQVPVIVETRTYKSEELFTCYLQSQAVRTYHETKDRYSNGTIVSRGRVHVSDGYCYNSTKSYSTVDVKVYSNCATFGQQSYVIHRYNVHPNAPHTFAGQVGSAGCGYY